MAAHEVIRSTFASLQGAHQHEGVRWMSRRESCPGAVPQVAGGILADEMGLGKTYQTVGLMRLRPMQTLIVTTLATLMQWQEVISSKMGTMPFVVRSKDQAAGLRCSKSTIQTVLTTYSLFSSEHRVPSSLMCVWGRIILDEAHVVRNPKSNTLKSLSRLQAVHRWALTGTPVHNTMRDLHTLVGWLGAPGLHVDIIRRELILRRTKYGEALRDPGMCMPLLEIHDSIVVLSEQERRAYELIEASGLADADTHTNSSAWHSPVHVHNFRLMEAVLRCRQVCTHPSIIREAVAAAVLVRDSECTSMQHAMKHAAVHDMAMLDLQCSTKISRLVELIATHIQEEKSLVFCDWLREMEIVETALVHHLHVPVLRYTGSMTLAERQNALHAFANLEAGAVLLLQIQCGGTGLSIQSASRVYLMRPAWNPCVEGQAIARAHRLGQVRPVIVTRLVAAHTIDTRCLEVQTRKLDVIDHLMKLDTETAKDLLTSAHVDTT